MPQWDQRSGGSGSSPGSTPGPQPPPTGIAPGKRSLTEQLAPAQPNATGRQPTSGTTPAAADAQPSGGLAALLAAPPPRGLANDPVVAHLEKLSTPQLLDELSDAVACAYAVELEARCSTSPRLMAALCAADLAQTAPLTPSHPVLVRAGHALDQVGAGEQLQILAWMLRRRGVSTAATTLVEGVLAMRAGGTDQEGGDHPEHAASGMGPTAGAAGKPASIEPGPWAPPGDQPGGLYVGNEAHKMIAAEYEAAHVGDSVLSNYYSISRVLGQLKQLQHNVNAGALSDSDLSLKPDIVNLTRMHLYEIKPENAQGLGAAKARLEIGLFARAGITVSLGPSGEPGTEGRLPAPAGVFMFWSPEPGVIVYQYRKGRLVPVPVPMPVPAGKPRWKWELKPLSPEQKRAVATTTVGGALLIMLMVVLSPVGI